MMDITLFHFLRPWFLLALIPVWALLWLLIKSRQNTRHWEALIDKDFLPHLLVSQNKNSNSQDNIKPIWQIAALLTLMLFAVSGPAWQKQAETFSEDQSELMFVIKVSQTMLEKDLRPDRLTRAIYKMEDLLKKRSQIKAGLIAYNGSAHLVMPLTADNQIISRFAHSLEPQMMPVKGDALADSLRLAEKQFSRSGTIIVISDSVDKEQIRQIKADPQLQKKRFIFYAIASAELLNLKQMRYAAAETGAELVVISPDDSDVERLLTQIENNFQQAQSEQAEYKDGGYYLLPLIALLLLPWYRRGFMAEAWRVQ